jgi:hypothetical protein
MKVSTFRTLYLLLPAMVLLQLCRPVFSRAGNNLLQNNTEDSLTRREQREIRRTELKKSKTKCNIYAGVVFGNLQTKVSFESPSGLVSANIGLEKHLGLPGTKTFYTAGVRYRFTPASGIYALYYGINRKEETSTTEDLVFLHDTLKAGKTVSAYFNTQVVSVGYLLSILHDPNAFLGVFLNVSLMSIASGVQSDIGKIDQKVNIIAPFPNFGMVADFRLHKWLYFAGEIGFFSLHTDSFGGTIYDLKAGLVAKPVKWLGLSLAYQEFDVNLFFPVDKIICRADYNFRGPTVGIHFTF